MISAKRWTSDALMMLLFLLTVVTIVRSAVNGMRPQIAFPITPCARKDGIQGSCTPRMVCQQFEADDPNICFGYNWVCCPPKSSSLITKPEVEEGPTPGLEDELSSQDCGVRPSIDPRTSTDAHFVSKRAYLAKHIPLVVGGRVSTPFSWPWMVAIQHTDDSGIPKLLCGGAIISSHYVITASHCFSQDEHNTQEPSHYSVRVAAHNLRQGKRHEVVRIVLHPDYVKTLHYNDIALVEVKSGMLSSRVRPVCLPDSDDVDDDFDGRNVTVTGWGDTSFGGFSSAFLREVTIPVVDRTKCNDQYQRLSTTTFPRGIIYTMLCAGLSQGGKDACQGDSGGPLVTEMSPNRWTIVGIVAFGYGCALPGYPGIYTRVSQYLDWVEDNTV